MPRVLELFAKRGLVPDRWHSAVVRPGMTLTIDIEIAGLEPRNGRLCRELHAADRRRRAGPDRV